MVKQYYVENHACATGWKKVDNCWYFFNPASGNNHKNDYETGEMLTGWVWLDDHWYFFNPENGMMQTGWVWSKAYQWHGIIFILQVQKLGKWLKVLGSKIFIMYFQMA